MNLWDYVDGALFAPARQRKQQEQKDLAFSNIAQLLDAQQRQMSAPPGSRIENGQAVLDYQTDGEPAGIPKNFSLAVPDTQFTARDQLDLYSALQSQGIEPGKFQQYQDDISARRALGEALPGMAPAQQVEALQRRDASPVRMEGGIAYNRFDTKNPLIAQSDSVDALTNQRNASADLDRARIESEQVDQRVKLQRPTGRAKYAIRGPDGSVRYKYLESYIGPNGRLTYDWVTGPDGKVLEFDDDAENQTALMRDTRYAASVRGISEQQVLEESQKHDIPIGTLRDIANDLIQQNRQLGNDPIALSKAVSDQVQQFDTINRTARTGAPPPPSREFQAAALAEARSAIARGAPRAAVEQELLSRGIDPRQLGQ